MKQTKPISITDQIQHSVSVLYDLFYFGSTFIHKQITEKNNQVILDDRTLSCEDGQLFNGEELVKDEKFLLVHHENLKTVIVNKPRESVYLSNAQDSAIRIDSDALIFIHRNSTDDYQIKIYPSKAKILLQSPTCRKGVFPFSVGDQLIIDYLMIEMREKQLKISDLKISYSWTLGSCSKNPTFPSIQKNFSSI